MKFSSLRNILSRAADTARRFPETLAAAFAGMAYSMVLIHGKGGNEDFQHLQVVTLAIPLFFAASMASETRERMKWLLRGGVCVAGVVLLYLFDRSFVSSRMEFFLLRYGQFSIGLHLLAAIAPFLGRGTEESFWQYNAELLLRFLNAALYTITLQIGLSIALGAVKNLLGVDVNPNAFAYLGCALGFGFNTWFFLSGVPRDLSGLEATGRYPAGLRLFTQYVLLPLVTVYFVILYLYIGKIVVQQSWPRGTIGYLVSAASVAGIFSLLLVHPLRESHEHRWIETYARWFYIALFPLVVTLVLAVWKRTDAYGLTEKRYFLFVIAGWLAAMSAYFTFSRAKNIKIIPATLCVLAFLTAVGPWSAYAVSRRWQMDRLQTLLTEIGAFENGRAKKVAALPQGKEEKEINSILSYLERTHGLTVLQAWFNIPLEKKSSTEILEFLGLRYISPWEREAGPNFYYAPSSEEATAVVISGADWMLRFSLSPHGRPPFEKELVSAGPAKEERFAVRLSTPALALVFRRNGAEIISVPLRPLFDRLERKGLSRSGNIPASELTLEAETEKTWAKINFRSLSGQKKDNAVEINSLMAEAFIGKKVVTNLNALPQSQ